MDVQELINAAKPVVAADYEDSTDANQAYRRRHMLMKLADALEALNREHKTLTEGGQQIVYKPHEYLITGDRDEAMDIADGGKVYSSVRSYGPWVEVSS